MNVNNLANITAMLMLLRDRLPQMRGNRLFNGVTENADKVEKAENMIKACFAYIESGANKSLDYFEKNSKKMDAKETSIAFAEIYHLSQIMERFLEALSDIPAEHHEAISVDFASVLMHYKVRPNKLLVAEQIRTAHEEVLSKKPTCSHNAFMLGYLAAIETMTAPKQQ